MFNFTEHIMRRVISEEQSRKIRCRMKRMGISPVYAGLLYEYNLWQCLLAGFLLMLDGILTALSCLIVMFAFVAMFYAMFGAN